MHIRNTFQIAAVALSLLLCGAATAEPIWTYDESTGTGPSQWGALEEGFHACADGRLQSPIDLARARPGFGPKLRFDYEPTELVIENNARTVEVVYAPGSTLRIGYESYRLLQFHFHTPSEHRLAGYRYPMEVHFVHMNSAGQLAVVGVFLRLGRANDALSRILDNAPQEEGEVHVDDYVSAEELMPRTRGYRNYSGSLTTPPCSEGVRWFVMKRSVEVSAAQVRQVREILEHVQPFPYNARPVQPGNGRRVTRVVGHGW